MRSLVLALLLAFPLLAGNLELKNGSVMAHTEMSMDKTIDPSSSSLHGEVNMDGEDITSLKGKFWVDLTLFKSDNSKRDANMYKDMATDKFKVASFTISSVVKKGDGYAINGTMNFHGVEKPMSADAKISAKDGGLTIEAKSKMLFSDYGMKMPCMVFMCVRDQVDLTIKANF